MKLSSNSFPEVDRVWFPAGADPIGNAAASRRRSSRRNVWAVLLISPLISGYLKAETITLTPSSDTALFEVSPSANLGGSTHVPVGGVGQGGGGKRGRALIKFDVSQIPANASVTSVSLTFRVVKTPSDSVSSTFQLHRVLQSWGEGNKGGNLGAAASANEATWNHRFAPSTPWTTPGASASSDYSASASASTFVGGLGSYTFGSTASLISDVQAWVNNASSNFGWIVISQSESTQLTARRIGTRESGADTPMLAVQYTPPPAAVQLSGKAAYYDGGKVVPGVTLQLGGDETATSTSANDGTFGFTVSPGPNYTLTAAKPSETPASQGVTTLDIALLRRQILALANFDSPYKLLAADVNNSGSVTTLDISLIRRVILGLSDTYPGGLWKFVPSDHQFADPTAPWNYDGTRSLNAINNLGGLDFIGIKLGDVNASWTSP